MHVSIPLLFLLCVALFALELAILVHLAFEMRLDKWVPDIGTKIHQCLITLNKWRAEQINKP